LVIEPNYPWKIYYATLYYTDGINRANRVTQCAVAMFFDGRGTRFDGLYFYTCCGSRHGYFPL